MRKKHFASYILVGCLSIGLFAATFFLANLTASSKEAYDSEFVLLGEIALPTDLANQVQNAAQQQKAQAAYETYYEKIEQLFEQAQQDFDGQIGLGYLDVTTGAQVGVNADQEFYSASTIKVPLAMLIADKVQRGELRWEQELTYNEEKDYEAGTGIIVNDIQPTYTVATLQAYNIIYSDNIAKNMLYDTFGDSVAAKKAIYATFLQKETDWDHAMFTANDALEILHVLYNEKATNPAYEQIYQTMKETVFHERLETATTQGHVAHKIGSYDTNIHDIGILETEHPVILAIFTDSPTDQGSTVIAQVADAIWNLQNTYYPQVAYPVQTS